MAVQTEVQKLADKIYEYLVIAKTQRSGAKLIGYFSENGYFIHTITEAIDKLVKEGRILKKETGTNTWYGIKDEDPNNSSNSLEESIVNYLKLVQEEKATTTIINTFQIKGYSIPQVENAIKILLGYKKITLARKKDGEAWYKITPKATPENILFEKVYDYLKKNKDREYELFQLTEWFKVTESDIYPILEKLLNEKKITKAYTKDRSVVYQYEAPEKTTKTFEEARQIILDTLELHQPLRVAELVDLVKDKGLDIVTFTTTALKLKESEIVIRTLPDGDKLYNTADWDLSAMIISVYAFVKFRTTATRKEVEDKYVYWVDEPLNYLVDNNKLEKRIIKETGEFIYIYIPEDKLQQNEQNNWVYKVHAFIKDNGDVSRKNIVANLKRYLPEGLKITKSLKILIARGMIVANERDHEIYYSITQVKDETERASLIEILNELPLDNFVVNISYVMNKDMGEVYEKAQSEAGRKQITEEVADFVLNSKNKAVYLAEIKRYGKGGRIGFGDTVHVPSVNKTGMVYGINGNKITVRFITGIQEFKKDEVEKVKTFETGGGINKQWQYTIGGL